MYNLELINLLGSYHLIFELQTVLLQLLYMFFYFHFLQLLLLKYY